MGGQDAGRVMGGENTTGLPPFRTADVDLSDPYPLYRRYREGDPVHLSEGAWYFFRHDDVARVLTNRLYGRGAPPARLPEECPHLRRTTANWMVFMDPPRHTRVRALVAKAFTPRIVEGLRPRIRRLAADLVTDLARQPAADLVDAFAAPLPILVISELLGVPREDRPWFRAQAVDLQQATSSRVARRADGFQVADAAARELEAYFRAELARRRAGRSPNAADLIAAMLHAEEQLPLGDEVLVGTCIHLLTAGHETTTNLIAKGLLALFAHPDQLALVRTRPELMREAVEELVRYDSPVQMISRWAGEDGEVGGRHIPKGGKVVLVLGSANRDPEHFDAPDRLDIRRDARRHTGFGMGIHYCVGAPLARAEAEIGLGELLRRLPRLALADEPVRWADDLVFHGPSRLTIRTGV
ncbi:cytochrome P450 [Streptomyces sp. NPDC046261]|uniref:cytochrome P450 n=1 Tax=Streptomyces sp. NPDC046261 TaxID=3157200 RepID=UPI00340A5DF1